MLKEIIDQFYFDHQEERIQTKFYISDAGKCHRQIFFKFKQAPKAKQDPVKMRIFEAGEWLHRYIYNVLYQSRIGVVTEISMPQNETISGRTDAIVCLNGENYIVDIKTMNSLQFRNLKQARDEHQLQVQLYMHFFNLKKAILLYIDKDKQELKEFIIEYDEGLVNELLRGLDELKDQIEKDIVPGVLIDYPKNWQCSYCQYREICDLAGKEELSWLEFKNKITNQPQKETLPFGQRTDNQEVVLTEEDQVDIGLI
ncbi:PD-(D/E)XK nuclease family protein [Candidatus Gribaldobacteria bacterium]|nr:PD-(D/E)XK nuclease family protein [Candidatus Gribaldobacteria bacterium]